MSEQFTRSQGPGGQNVNKVSSAVELRFEAERSPNLPDTVKRRLKNLAGRRWTADGALLLRVEDTRSQARNREIARTRLTELIRRATVTRKRRIPTRPSAGAMRRRKQSNIRRSTIKALRSHIPTEDE